MAELLLIFLVVGGVVFALSRMTKKNTKQLEQTKLDDALADARHWTDRLGSQVLSLAGSDAASTQAIADASERFNAASSQLSTADTVRKAELAREAALEGLWYMNAAREIMGMPKGPDLPPLEGQRKAGRVTERRTIEHEGETITASPQASAETPNYYPGGMVAGRPVPAGWYSRPWWASALSTGLWTAGSVLLFSSLFSGMAGVGYSAAAFENGYGEGYEDGLAAAGENASGDDLGGGDAGGDDFGGEDFGGDTAAAADDGGFFGGDGLFGGDGGDGLFGGDGGFFGGDGGFDFDF